MIRPAKIVMLVFFMGIFLFALNAHAWKSIEWSVSPDGKVDNNREVIEGRIVSIDPEKMEITFGKSDLMGKEPLRLNKETVCYKGDERTDIVSVRGGTKFQKDDKLSLENLKVGDYIKCNYTIKDRKFWARRIILITPYHRMH